MGVVMGWIQDLTEGGCNDAISSQNIFRFVDGCVSRRDSGPLIHPWTHAEKWGGGGEAGGWYEVLPGTGWILQRSKGFEIH